MFLERNYISAYLKTGRAKVYVKFRVVPKAN